MKHKFDGPHIIGIALLLMFFISLIHTCVSIVKIIIYAFQNSALTLTQVIIWSFNSNLLIPIAILMISYIGLAIWNEKYGKDNLD